MSNTAIPIGEDDLQAFIDGRLPPERHEAVQTLLTGRPDLADRVQRDQTLAGMLAERLAFKAEEPVPMRLRVATIVAERQRGWRRRLAVAAAACLLLAAGGGLGWWSGTILGPQEVQTEAMRWDRMAEGAIAAHRLYSQEIAHPVEIEADQKAELAQWIVKKLKHQLPVPDLSAIGYQLMGGRVLPTGSEAAAQLMYEDASGQRITIYIKAGEDGASAMRYVSDGDVSAYYWVDDGCGYVVSAALGRDRLHEITQAAFHAFES